jgi:hypothetical protein
MAGKLIPTAAQDGDGAMPSAPPKLGGGAKSKNHLRRMKAKAKKLAEQPIDQPVADDTEQGASGDPEVKEEQDEDVPVSIGCTGSEALCRELTGSSSRNQMPASSAASAEFDLNDPAMAMFSSVFAKFQGDADQEMADEVVG